MLTRTSIFICLYVARVVGLSISQILSGCGLRRAGCGGLSAITARQQERMGELTPAILHSFEVLEAIISLKPCRHLYVRPLRCTWDGHFVPQHSHLACQSWLVRIRPGWTRTTVPAPSCSPWSKSWSTVEEAQFGKTPSTAYTGIILKKWLCGNLVFGKTGAMQHAVSEEQGTGSQRIRRNIEEFNHIPRAECHHIHSDREWEPWIDEHEWPCISIRRGGRVHSRALLRDSCSDFVVGSTSWVGGSGHSKSSFPRVYWAWEPLAWRRTA